MRGRKNAQKTKLQSIYSFYFFIFFFKRKICQFAKLRTCEYVSSCCLLDSSRRRFVTFVVYTHTIFFVSLLGSTHPFYAYATRIHAGSMAAALGGCVSFAVSLFFFRFRDRVCMACGCDSSLKFIFDNINNTEVIFNK